MLLNHSIAVSHFVLVNNFVLVNRKGDSSQCDRGKNDLEKSVLRRCQFILYQIILLCSKKKCYSTVFYHHPKSFTWLLSLKFVTQESPRRIFKPENELPDRIVTISPCLNFHHRHLQESPRGVFQSRERIPSKLKPPDGLVEPPFGVGVKPSHGSATQPPSPAPHPAEHSYRWELETKTKTVLPFSLFSIPIQSRGRWPGLQP